MSHLVRDDVRLGEVARGAELDGELAEEAGVEVDPPVQRAVERTDGRRRGTAAGAHHPAEDHERRGHVLDPAALERARPEPLDVVEHELQEAPSRRSGSGASSTTVPVLCASGDGRGSKGSW